MIIAPCRSRHDRLFICFWFMHQNIMQNRHHQCVSWTQSTLRRRISYHIRKKLGKSIIDCTQSFLQRDKIILLKNYQSRKLAMQYHDNANDT
jgi:hypothetical protein